MAKSTAANAAKVAGARRAGRPASTRRSGPAPEVLDGGMPELDRIIHERLRLGIVSALAGADRLSFNELKQLLKITDGNLSVHARKLEDAGYIACNKFFEGRKPQSEFRLTAVGRKALERYLDHMEALIKVMRGR